MGQIEGHPYIERVPGILSEEPVIVGTRTPVRAIVEMCRLGYTPEEIPEHLPHLTVDQVYGALSYYNENQVEIEGYIQLNYITDDMIGPVDLSS